MDAQSQLLKMKEMYSKLYKKYSDIKTAKFRELDEVNGEQEHKFAQFVNGSDNLIDHLQLENKRMSDDIDGLRNELIALRTAKDQECEDLQQRLAEEKQKNRLLSVEIEQLRQLHQEGLQSNNTNDKQDHPNTNNTQHNVSESPSQLSNSPMRMTRKRARLSTETNSPLRESSIGPCLDTQPECCQSNTDKEGEGPHKCFFQNMVEYLTGMKVSIANRPEGRCIHAIHENSGYTFDLTWVDKASSQGNEELLYQVSSLGTLAAIAPEFMREVIIFNVRMCPKFFKMVSHVVEGI